MSVDKYRLFIRNYLNFLRNECDLVKCKCRAEYYFYKGTYKKQDCVNCGEIVEHEVDMEFEK